MRISGPRRRQYLAFLLHAIMKLRFKPQSMTKYCAIVFFHERYLPCLERQLKNLPSEIDIQFNGILCLWIASKLHETPPISIRKLQNLTKKLIPDHYYTKRDFIDAEVKFMKAIDFDLKTGPLVSTYIEELLTMFSVKMAEIAKLVSLKLCLAILDLLYVCDDELLKGMPIEVAGASILAAAYVVVVPIIKYDFPMLAWLHQATNTSPAKLKDCTSKILKCVLAGISSVETIHTALANIC